ERPGRRARLAVQAQLPVERPPRRARQHLRERVLRQPRSPIPEVPVSPKNDIDAERFLALDTVRHLVRRIPQDEFVSKYGPSIQFSALGDGDASESDDGTKSSKGKSRTSAAEKSIRRTLAHDDKGAAAAYHDRVAFLTKRPGNPFPQMVSIGRAMNNDIVILLETISKLHGYFWL